MQPSHEHEPVRQLSSVAEDWRAGGFGLYVHWPFCAAKCPYCDFNSHVALTIDEPRWTAAFRAEIARVATQVPGRVLNSIFFGGGTPSLMSPETVSAIIEAARSAWPAANDIEVTLEANPTSVEAERFRGYRDAGVNRLSMGVQALHDADLHRLGRQHSAAEARAAFDIARQTFDRVSFDLIYARQGQTRSAWRRELNDALAMAADHLSLYQLTIEPGTAFGMRHAAGQLNDLPDEDLSADMYFDTQEICDHHGYAGYEISNYAAVGSECRHNLIYWRQGDWAAVGPGAHGRLSLGEYRRATEAIRAPGAWLKAVEAQGSGDLAAVDLSRSDRAVEYMLMSMRLGEGMDMARFARLNGTAVDADRVASLAELGLVTVADGRLRATATGRPVLNALLRELAP
ncbi:radical SAM family heme chaperone HemW [uncultured Paracoccus sp.]|uniref:radical SAM family heme chaperone HemW n=1 Tax=uncultured Paracoccus sp. TaxID=189685 RepID=UPI002626B057|nr:radical SAM family heme chaperone HemW [uncultured Paracoccus sp.]